MGMSEADTRVKLIDPRLHDAGWTETLLQREFPYKRGRIRLIGEHTTRDAPQYVDYVLRDAPRGEMLAVVEAKDEDHSLSAGLAQALGYARDLGVKFAYSSNGHGIVEHDRLTNAVTELQAFPTPTELRDRLIAGDTSRGPRVKNRLGAEVDNPLIQPAWAPPGGSGGMRWYQERAVVAALEQMLADHHRALLSLATGTGKTFIAFNLVWKLLRAGYAKKVLFLADRVSLRDQAYNEFGALDQARGVVAGGVPPLHRDVHFGIYQGLYAPLAEGGRLFEHYPADYFDLIIIDECHRSGYGDWRAILDRFDSAFHLGLTATPKRTDSIDTYEFFASENRDGNGEAQPAFEYSLGRGIDDGYLATYRVRQIRTNIDKVGLRVEEEIERGADLIVPEGQDVRDVYVGQQFEREIVVPDRTRTLCEHLAGLLRTWGVNEKTMIFCVNMEHAALVRDLLQSMLGPETGKEQYAIRIVSEEHDSEALLRQFQLSSSTEPIVATTVDLLTTGVNVPSVRNIVFMKGVSSPTIFKQIIGRGSRLDEATGKEFFRIVDYTRATRLFDEWDLPDAGPGGRLPDTGDGVLAGRVVVHGTTDPIEGATIVVRAGMRELAEVRTEPSGTFTIGDLPEGTLTVQVAARGFTQRTIRVPVTWHGEEVVIGLREPTAGAERVIISGVTVSVAEETELTLGSGQELTVEQYIDHAGEQVRTASGDVGTLAELWRDPDRRRKLREQFRTHDVDPEVLGILLARPDADDFDLLAHAGYETAIHSREERARAVEQSDGDFLDDYSERQRQVVQALLDKYRLAGVEEIASADIFAVAPFADEFGGIHALVGLFGGPAELRGMLLALQNHLYDSSDAA